MNESFLGLVLPWPPSINHYWRRCGARYFISKEGIDFRKKVSIVCKDFKNYFPPTDKIFIQIDAYPPDRRRRDIDNILKSLLDALQHASLYKDDNQIEGIHIQRMPQLESKVIINVGVYLNQC